MIDASIRLEAYAYDIERLQICSEKMLGMKLTTRRTNTVL